MKILSEEYVIKSTTLVSEVNQENSKRMIRGNQTKRTIYLHLNNTDIHHNQFKNLYYSEQKQQTYVPKENDVSTIQSNDNKLSQLSINCQVSQKINLGWSDPFSM